MDIYLGRKEIPEFNLGLGKEVVLELTKDFEQAFCKHFKKEMSKMIDDKQMKRGDCEFLFSGNIVACKRMGNWSVLFLKE